MSWDWANWSRIFSLESNSTRPVKTVCRLSASTASCTRAGSKVPKSVAPIGQRSTCLLGEAGPFPVEGGAELPQAASSIASRHRSVGKSVRVNVLRDRIGDFSFVYEELP